MSFFWARTAALIGVNMAGALARHDRLLSLLGAGIVLATFVVKDTLREKWKGTAEVVERAEDNFALRTQLNGITEAQGSLIKQQLAMSDVVDDIARPKTHNTASLPPLKVPPGYCCYINVDRYQEMAHSQRAQLSEVEELLHVIDDPSLVEQVMTLQQNTQALIEALNEAWIKERGRWNLPSYGLYVNSDLNEKIVSVLGETNSPANLLTEKALDEAKKVRDANKKRASVAGWVTGALFLIGWCLSLTGTLAKGEP